MIQKVYMNEKGNFTQKAIDVSVISTLVCWEKLALIDKKKAGNSWNVEQNIDMDNKVQLSSGVRLFRITAQRIFQDDMWGLTVDSCDNLVSSVTIKQNKGCI